MPTAITSRIEWNTAENIRRITKTAFILCQNVNRKGANNKNNNGKT